MGGGGEGELLISEITQSVLDYPVLYTKNKQQQKQKQKKHTKKPMLILSLSPIFQIPWYLGHKDWLKSHFRNLVATFNNSL